MKCFDNKVLPQKYHDLLSHNMLHFVSAFAVTLITVSWMTIMQSHHQFMNGYRPCLTDSDCISFWTIIMVRLIRTPAVLHTAHSAMASVLFYDSPWHHPPHDEWFHCLFVWCAVSGGRIVEIRPFAYLRMFMCHTTRADDGNRTRIISLEDWNSNHWTTSACLRSQHHDMLQMDEQCSQYA